MNHLLRNMSVFPFFIIVLCCGLVEKESQAMGIVTDPGSYAYYAQQIEAAYTQATTLAAQLETVEKAYDTANKQLDQAVAIKKKLEGYYNFAQSTAERIKNIQGLPEELLAPMAVKLSKKGEAMFTSSNKEVTWKQLGKELERLYGKRAKGDVPSASNQERVEYIQGSHYASLLTAEKELSLVGKRNKRLDSLISNAKAAQNVNEQQAVTSAILAEILAGQNEMIILLANIAKASSADRFKKRKPKVNRRPASSSSQLKRDADRFNTHRENIKRIELGA